MVLINLPDNGHLATLGIRYSMSGFTGYPVPVSGETTIIHVGTYELCKPLIFYVLKLKNYFRVADEDISSGKPYKCSQCNKSFSKSQNLRLHLKVHSGLKPYSCSICSGSFTALSSLKHHVRANHTENKPYSCLECDKSFAVPKFLKQHMKVHAGVKSYCCNDCPESFAVLSSLKQHVKTHNGEQHYHLLRMH